ncbi:protein TonB [Catalinimonas alkaloidigena]|uniref:energy transducer TonB n=1 Tax=Catalinimonas alkaloidigena TaxID=1075417 RepID=UPI0024063AC2|nr:energy transducer TonB [Catalinimonas alkaloidigena]MDF9795679.1 protein TonB [Catalinimonas alkaloidigena]
MESKKTPKADLNNRTGLHLSIGLVISLAVVTLAFEWKSYDDQSLVDLGVVEDDFEDVMEIPPTEQPPPPPPKIQQPEIIEVPDEEEIEEEIEIDLDVEITEDTQIEEMVFEEAPEEEVSDEIFMVVEDQPEPQGGMQAFYEYVGKNLKYPSQARRMGIEGKVFVQFVVNTDGSITQVQAIKGIGAGCDAEAVRVLENAPKWKPGKQRGRPVRVRMVLPITFKLG